MAEPEARAVGDGAWLSADRIAELVASAHEAPVDDEGLVNDTYPSLARVDPNLWGVAVTSVDGFTSSTGDAQVPFVVMSVSKPFVFALVASHLGVHEASHLVGMEATGLPFNALASADRPSNPMVTSGAIATSALAPGSTTAQRWAAIRGAMSAFAGRELDLDDETYASARATNVRIRDLAARLASAGLLRGEPDDAADLYALQCCLRVTAIDLAAMGATLANGGVQPVTGERVVSAEAARGALVAMTIAGLYQASGRWLLETGLPAKSGIGGGFVAVAPGKAAIATFGPRLDAVGTSVRGARATAILARTLGLDLFARPSPVPRVSR